MSRWSIVPIEQRFWQKVYKTDNCWFWLGGTSGDGYGRIERLGALTGAHRVSWILHYGEIPKGKLVLHLCDIPQCVRPSHLYLGTWKDNSRERDSRGRSNLAWMPRKGNEDVLELQGLRRAIRR